jgi:hypothetical protein
MSLWGMVGVLILASVLICVIVLGICSKPLEIRAQVNTERTPMRTFKNICIRHFPVNEKCKCFGSHEREVRLVEASSILNGVNGSGVLTVWSKNRNPSGLDFYARFFGKIGFTAFGIGFNSNDHFELFRKSLSTIFCSKSYIKRLIELRDSFNIDHRNPRSLIEAGIISYQYHAVPSSIGGFLGGTHQEDIHNQQSEGNNDRCDFNTFFPSWSIVFAPIGIAVIGWGWWNIRDNRWQSFITFLIGCILWMYGFAAVLMRISMF